MNTISPVHALWAAVLITGVYPVAGKFAVGIISPSLLLLCSTALAVLFFAPWITKHKYWGVFFRKDTFLPFCMIGLLSNALAFLFMLIALQYTTPANAAILNQTEVIYSLILSMIFLRERPTGKQLLGTAMVISGVVIILLGESFSLRWKGDLIVISTVWMFQLSHVFAKKLPAHLPPQVITAGRCIFAFAWSLPIAFILSRFSFDVSTFVPGWKLLAILLYMGVINYAIGNALWYRAIRNMDLSKATAVILSYPVITYLISVFAGMDTLNLSQIAGLVLALSGAYLVTHIIKKGNNKNEIGVI